MITRNWTLEQPAIGRSFNQQLDAKVQRAQGPYAGKPDIIDWKTGLLFVFADRHDHPERKRLDPQAFNLGSGDRALVKGGTVQSSLMLVLNLGKVKRRYVEERRSE